MKGLAIIMFSGEAEKFIPLGVLAQTAANLGVPVRVFVTGFASLYFTRNKPEPRFSDEFRDLAPRLEEGLARMNAPSWYDMLKDAKEAGDVKVYMCSLMAEAAGIKKEDLDPIVDGIVGATTFMAEAADYEVIFI